MSRRLFLAILLCLSHLFCDFDPAFAQSKRIALVLGNSGYTHSSKLPNASSDASAIAAALVGIGFAVTLAQDLSHREMREAIRTFGREAPAADMAAVYFAGHGIESNGENWLLPTSAELRHERDLDYEAISLSSILTAVHGARRLRLVILDACRNNPLGDRIEIHGSRFRTVTRGLARIEPPGNVLVAYSAKHGTVAEDGPAGGTSPFADGLLKHLASPGLDIRILMGRVRDHVVGVTEGRQEPFTYGSVGGEAIMLVEPLRTVAGRKGDTSDFQGPSNDELAWLRATAANRLDGFREYLSQFPGGKFRSEALARIERLGELRSRWLSLQRSTDRVAIEALIVEADSTEFSQVAKQMLIDVLANEERAWVTTEESKLLARYEEFLSTWPHGRYTGSARQRISELSEIKTSWISIATTEDEIELETFVRKHGWSEYGAAATARLIALRREKAMPPDEHFKALSAGEFGKTIDGHKLTFTLSGATLRFDSAGQPPYRSRLGKDFFRTQLKQSPSGEGSFQADVQIEGRGQRIEGLGAIVKSKVDGTGSLFLLQMHGNERSAVDVDRRDRHYASLQILQDYFGLVCIMTTWESILSTKAPEKIVERCKISQ